MDVVKRFKDHYEKGFMPWAHKNPDFNLVEMVEEWPINPCNMLEMGCGTGVDALWLASQNFKVTACDVSEIAIDMAKKQQPADLSNCRFHVLDCQKDPIPGSPFEFIFERGYFHSYRTRKSRKEIAGRIADLLRPKGLWLTISGSCDAPEREEGPPRLSIHDIADAVEKNFKILSITATHFGSEEKNPARAWVCLFRKREK